MASLDSNFQNDDEANGQTTSWHTLSDEAQWADLLKQSHQQPVVVFKHSVTCGISAMAKHELEQTWDFDTEEVAFYYLDLIRYRSISNRIAEDLNVWHQSPQLILIKDGQSIYHASHAAIKVSKVKAALA
jgi:bacillithiol system protein YtxJ